MRWSFDWTCALSASFLKLYWQWKVNNVWTKGNNLIKITLDSKKMIILEKTSSKKYLWQSWLGSKTTEISKTRYSMLTPL